MDYPGQSLHATERPLSAQQKRPHTMTQQTPQADVTAALLIIGNEILSGRTKDANLPFLAEKLNGIGVRLREARVVPDIEAEIIDAVNALRARYDYVFTTGGIGPTHDDITSECIAKAFGVALERHPDAVRRLQEHYQTDQINEARLRMANVPAGGILVDNPVSKAPGYQIGNVFVLAGVPMIMQGMVDNLLPRLKGGAPMLSRTVSCALAEGTLAEGLEAVQNRYPDDRDRQLPLSSPETVRRQSGASRHRRGPAGGGGRSRRGAGAGAWRRTGSHGRHHLRDISYGQE